MIYRISNGTNPWSRVWAACLLLLLVPLAQAQAPEAYGKSDDPVVAEARGVQIRTSNPDEMAYVIKQILLQLPICKI